MDAAGTFDLIAPSLVDAGLRVLAPDMRGFGRGPRVPEGSYYYFADYIADVAAIVRQAVAALRDRPLHGRNDRVVLHGRVPRARHQARPARRRGPARQSAERRSRTD